MIDSNKLTDCLNLSAEAWSAIQAIGGCACCAARLTGCREKTIYACDEPFLRAQINASFAHRTLHNEHVDQLPPDGDRNPIDVTPCPLCLGLLQPELDVQLMPAAKPSTEAYCAGESSRAADGCSSTAVHQDSSEIHDEVASSKYTNNERRARVTGKGAPKENSTTPHVRRRRLADKIIEGINSRGHAVTGFTLTAAVPACLAVRQAALRHTLGALLPGEGALDIGNDAHTVSVKDALKLAVQGSLESKLDTRCDGEADLVIEIVAKADKADRHAALLLGKRPPSSPGTGKGPGWPGQGRWAKKRQRREEHRHPGLTMGAVRKELSNVSAETLARMRRWVKGVDTPPASAENAAPECPEVDAVDHEALVSGSKATAEKVSESVDEQKTEHQLGFVDDLGTAASNSFNARCEVVLKRQPVYIWGRYVKMSRSIPQTPWIRGFFSVQEAVAEPFERFSGCVEGLLHGAGREDIDVRMLGNGRPFCLELIDSKRSAAEIEKALPTLTDAVNDANGVKNRGGGVRILDTRMAKAGDLPSDVQRVGEGKHKHYRCVVWVSRRVSPEELAAMCTQSELVIQQSTPLRVLHRRTLLERPRSIYDMHTEWINDYFFVLSLKTSAGTYIKEFVHGDLGRTSPSVGTLLGCRADILQLDVTEVEDKWGQQQKTRSNQEAHGSRSIT